MSRELTCEQYERFVKPRSVAVIGVSERTGPEAYNLVENLDAMGCACRIYPVNIRAREVAGHKAYASVADLPEVVDLAVISTPREVVPAVVGECLAKGVRSLVVVTQGFDDGDAEGHRLQQELNGVLAGGEARLIGPNTIGVANLLDGFHTSFQQFDLDTNKSAWLCQSGAFILGAADFSGGLGLGIDIGNGADVGFTELLPWMGKDPRIEIINIHMEGIRRGADFLAAAGEITRRKPIVVFKTGRSEAGARAAVSHSGSLAGDDEVLSAAFRKAGIIRADSIDEVADLNKALLSYREMPGRRVAVITISGGTGIAAVDALSAQGLQIATLSPQTIERLQVLYPPWFQVENPVDFWPAAMRGGYRETCRAMLDLVIEDANVDAVLFVMAAYRATGFTVIGPVLDALAEQAAACRHKPVAFWVLGANQDAAIAELEKRGGVAGFTSPDRAARALAGLHRYVSEIRGRATAARPVLLGLDREKAADLLSSHLAQRRQVLGTEMLELLKAYGVKTVPLRLAADRDEAAALGRQIGFPLAMKIASPDIVHKSDVGGVRLNIQDQDELLAAYDGMLQSVRTRFPIVTVDGVHLQKHHSAGTEVIIGARRDPEFGPVVVFGLGGVYTEILNDVALRLAPLTEKDAREMIRETRVSRILDGVRGAPAADVQAIVDDLLRVSQLMMDFPEIEELDINPMVAGPEGTIALDARAVLKHGGAAGL